MRLDGWWWCSPWRFLHLICSRWQWGHHFHNENESIGVSLMSCWQKRKQQVSCLPQINNWRMGNEPVQWMTPSTLVSSFVLLFLLIYQIQTNLGEVLRLPLTAATIQPKAFCQSRQSLVAHPHISLRRPPQLWTAYLLALLPESDCLDEIPTQLNIWALCCWCPHK